MGIIKRFKEQVVAADPNLTNQTYQGLPYMVQAKLEGLFSTGLVQRTELDAKCFIELRQLPEPVALEVLDKVRVHIHTHTHTHARTRARAHARTHTHATHTHTHTHTRTHARTPPPPPHTHITTRHTRRSKQQWG